MSLMTIDRVSAPIHSLTRAMIRPVRRTGLLRNRTANLLIVIVIGVLLLAQEDLEVGVAP